MLPLSLALVALALAPARPEPAPPLLPSPVDARAAAARAAYAAGDYLSAARQYESLARDAPRYFFNAGMAREAAGEPSHAAIQWRRYLSSGTATPEDRALLERKLAAAGTSLVARRLRPEPGVTAVTLQRGGHDPIDLTPAELADPLLLETGEWTARVQSAGEPRELGFTVAVPDAPPVVLPAARPRVDPPPPPPVTTGSLTVQVGPPRALRRGVALTLAGDADVRQETLRSATATWELPRGPWTLSAAAPDRTDTRRTVTVTDVPQRVDLTLHLSPAARGRRIVAPALLGATGLGLLVGGAALAARTPHRDLLCTDAATCEATANDVLDRASGFALVGGGLGALVPAATAAAGARPRALVVEAGLGAALLASGVGWYLAEFSKTTALEHFPQKNTAATMLGLGAGMAGSAVIQLLVHRALRARRPARTRQATP
ncbi:MAG: hypothetical protein JNL82_27625 [Myxococcales bacterium]|nr:hypothetical protein [Myxococcales bacterium]